MNHQPPRNWRIAQSFQHTLALLRGFLMQSSFLCARRIDRALHYRGFLLDSLDQLLPAFLLQLIHAYSLENGSLRIRRGQQPTCPAKQRAETFARLNAVNARLANLPANGYRRTDIFPPALLGHGQHITIAERSE